MNRGRGREDEVGESPMAPNTDHLEGAAEVRLTSSAPRTVSAGEDRFDDHRGPRHARRRSRRDATADLVARTHPGQRRFARIRMEVAAADAARMDLHEHI